MSLWFFFGLSLTDPHHNLQQHDRSTPGSICLVGAGPGEVGLITVRGLERLRQADVVVYDALANPALLAQAPPDAERIDVGKRAREHKLTQDQTNALLVAKARDGRFVVRLKGGDPYLFGRGAEEVAYAAKHGIACEVVPGITSGIAAPMMAGIPVTHRQLASTVTFVTGHEDPTKAGTAVDYGALAKLIAAGGTACFYMGVGRVAGIVAALREGGLSGDTSAAAVQWGTLPTQRSLRATLETLAATIDRESIAPPAILVVGPVASMDEPGLDFFTRRPLFGQTILVTRTRQQSSSLAQQLAELGANVLEAPTIEISMPAKADVLPGVLSGLLPGNWLVLASVNGVAALARDLAAAGGDARQLAGVKIAAVGEATAAALWHQLHLKADLVPTRFTAESLAGEMLAREDLQGRRVLILQADIARPALATALRDAGAVVETCVAYQTRMAEALPEAVWRALRERKVDWVTCTSSSTARNLVTLLGDERELLRHPRIASIGPVTSDTIRELGYDVTVEAQPSTVAALVAAIGDDKVKG